MVRASTKSRENFHAARAAATQLNKPIFSHFVAARARRALVRVKKKSPYSRILRIWGIRFIFIFDADSKSPHMT